MRNIFFAFIILSSFINSAKAEGLALIRDAEIEDFLYDLTWPIFKTSGLDPNRIEIYIVNDNTINAFVAGGQNVFINTGLITKYKDPDVLIGVLAHETGHMAAGHLARGSEDMKNAGNTMLATYILGIAAAVANPSAGMALIMGGSQIAQRTSLKFTRGQEEAADQLALKYLNKLNYPADGLLKLLELFASEESAYKGQIDEYALTHPISKKRINFIKAYLKNEHLEKPANYMELQRRLNRIIVKLNAFLGKPDQILQEYNQNNTDSKYANVIAYYKKGNVKQAISIVDDLIQKNPNDGYLYDLKGQILLESGNLELAIVAYKKTIDLLPNNNLARISLANAIINLNLGDKEITNVAIDNLKIALRKEVYDPSIYKQLSVAYNQNNETGKSYLALAEYNLMQNDKKKATKYAKLAKKNLDKNDKVNLLRADDILEFAKKIKRDDP